MIPLFMVTISPKFPFKFINSKSLDDLYNSQIGSIVQIIISSYISGHKAVQKNNFTSGDFQNASLSHLYLPPPIIQRTA